MLRGIRACAFVANPVWLGSRRPRRPVPIGAHIYPSSPRLLPSSCVAMSTSPPPGKRARTEAATPSPSGVARGRPLRNSLRIAVEGNIGELALHGASAPAPAPWPLHQAAMWCRLHPTSHSAAHISHPRLALMESADSRRGWARRAILSATCLVFFFLRVLCAATGKSTFLNIVDVSPVFGLPVSPPPHHLPSSRRRHCCRHHTRAQDAPPATEGPCAVYRHFQTLMVQCSKCRDRGGTLACYCALGSPGALESSRRYREDCRLACPPLPAKRLRSRLTPHIASHLFSFLFFPWWGATTSMKLI